MVEQEVTVHKAALDAEHRRRMAELDREVEQRALQMLDELTNPTAVA